MNHVASRQETSILPFSDYKIFNCYAAWCVSNIRKCNALQFLFHHLFQTGMIIYYLSNNSIIFKEFCVDKLWIFDLQLNVKAWFLQARAIAELAKKVFHVLKTDPDNFELEFSGTRRRSGRRPQHEVKGSTYSPSLKVARSSKSSNTNTAVHVSPKPTPCLTSCSSSLKRAIRVNSACLGITTHSDARDDEVLFGEKWILFWPPQNQIS